MKNISIVVLSFIAPFAKVIGESPVDREVIDGLVDRDDSDKTFNRDIDYS